jgi:hypothetical protein
METVPQQSPSALDYVYSAYTTDQQYEQQPNERLQCQTPEQREHTDLQHDNSALLCQIGETFCLFQQDDSAFDLDALLQMPLVSY